MNRSHGHLRAVSAALFVSVAVIAPNVAFAADVVVLHDPAGDDHGPGTYVHPAADGFRPGTFDLLKLTLKRTGQGVAVTAAFGVAPQLIEVRSDRDDTGHRVFMQVIDIYVATNPARDSGHREVLPGRRFSVSGGFGWDRAVVIGSAPDMLQAHYARVSPSLSADICFPKGAKVVGRSISVFVPGRCLPVDLETACYLVVVTGLGPGAGMGRSLTADDPQSPDATDPYVREIGPNPGTCNVWEDGVGRSPCTFGGCKPCGWHPFVIDAIVPGDQSQEALLADYNRKERRLSTLGFVSSCGKAVHLADIKATGPEGDSRIPRHKVVSVRGRQLTIQVAETLEPGTIGALVCPGEKAGGTVVVRGSAAGFVVLEKVGDDAPPCKGAQVEF